MRVIEDVVSAGHGSLDASYACIHETANPGATARNHRDLWSRDDTYAVHYVCDWTGGVYHCVPDDRLCYQVGNGNAYVVGLEICHAADADDFKRAWDTAVEWARWMLEKNGWGVDRLISHDDARKLWGGTDHTDPLGYFAAFGRTWDDFVAAVADGQPEQQDDNHDDSEETMQCIIQPNGLGKLCYFDGSKITALSHPDQVTALDMAYRACHGRGIPVFAMGEVGAPWASRLLQTVGGDDAGFPSF